MRKFLAVVSLVLVAGCTGSKSGSGSDKLDHLIIAPDGASIDTTTTVVLKATGVTESGRHVEVTDVEWTTDVGTIGADGSFSSTSPGDAAIAAEAEGVDGTATVHVIGTGSLSVTVVDATTGAPVTGAEVSLVTSSSGAITIADGTATLTGAFSGSIDIQVTATNYWPMSIYGLKAKNVRIPIRPENPPAPGFFSGSLDFTQAYDADAPEAGHLWVGIGGPAIKGNVLAFGLDSLLGPNREVEIIGTTIDAPSNLYVHGFTEPFLASAPAGQTVAFGLGGEVAISTITDIIGGGGADLGDVITELLPIFNSFYYATREGVNVASNQTVSGQDMILTQSLSKHGTILIGPRPVTDPNPLVVAAVDFGPDIGLVPAGLTALQEEGSQTEAEIQVPPLSGAFEDRKYIFLVVSEEGGLGTNGDQQLAVLSRGHTNISEVETPAWLTPQSFASFTGDGATRTFNYAASSEADFMFSVFTRTLTVGTADGPTLQWDVVTAGDSTGFVLPMVATTNAAQAGGSWTVQTLGLESQTYDSLFTPGSPIDATNYFNDANRVVISNADVD